jgi:hypothetical protein
MGDTNVKVKVSSQNTFPIRMFCTRWHETRNTIYGGFTYLSSVNEGQNAPIAVALSNTFSCASNVYLSPDLSDKLDDILREKYSYYENKNPHFKAMYENHLPETLKIINAFGGDFDGWEDFYDLETAVMQEQAIAALPDLSLEDYNPSVTTCEIAATLLNKDKHIQLIVNPRKLFNALVVAENTGAALEYIAPKNLTTLGDIRIFAPHPVPQGKPRAKALK